MIESTHPHAVWRDRANFIVAASLPEEGRTEQLWARQLDAQRFEVCCIPFFLYDVALGDVVETDAALLLKRVTRASGRYVFRVWFGEGPGEGEEIAKALIDQGCLIEWSSPNLLAVDTVDADHASKVAGYLQQRETEGGLLYETGKT